MADPKREDDDRCALCEERRAARPRRSRIGRAFDECWRCGRLVERPGVTEWDFHAPAARRVIAARRVTFALLGGLVVPLAYVVAVATGARPWAWLEALIALGAGWLAVGAWEAGAHAAEVRASRRRLAGDPMYRARLVERGIAASRT